MSDIVIRNIEMPKAGTTLSLLITSDGKVYKLPKRDCAMTVQKMDSNAIELPPYSRLIDIDVLPINNEDGLVSTGTIWDAPIILESKH